MAETLEYPTYDAIARRIAATGLAARGGFHPSAEDGLPGAARTLVLIGDRGGVLWSRFASERKDEADPLDTWTRRVLERVAEDIEATVIYPFDGPPHWPFQKWAMRAEGLKPSPVGPLIHPEFGLWHSYRGALLFSDEIALPSPPVTAHPCDNCAERPCLAACPVDAFAGDVFALAACIDHQESALGDACRDGGCLARRACPVGAGHAYAPDHMAFLQAAFLKTFGGKAAGRA